MHMFSHKIQFTKGWKVCAELDNLILTTRSLSETLLLCVISTGIKTLVLVLTIALSPLTFSRRKQVMNRERREEQEVRIVNTTFGPVSAKLAVTAKFFVGDHLRRYNKIETL
jgi:hypothetical protein